MQDPQSMPGTFCPLNNFGLLDYDRLHLLEAPAVHRRQLQLEDPGIPGTFNSAHLSKIHWFLFRDVCPWAGDFRLVDMAKVGGAPFASPRYIADSVSTLLSQLQQENYLRDVSRPEFAQRAGYYLGELNAIHAFREGNGRTQREFIRQLALQCDVVISWEGISAKENTDASILSHTRGDHSGLARLISKAREGAAQS